MNSLYRPCHGNSFRLLEKIPGAHDRDLRFRFVHTNSDRAPQYTAVSYTWGDNESTEIIYVDNRRVMIRPNLWACLHQLRRSWDHIWADAICINQGDVSEKNEQVRLMRQIYSGATVVSVWLGLMPLPPMMRFEGVAVTLEADDFDWSDHMDDLAGRPYWSRSWVIQEFLLARDIRICCSNFYVDYDIFQDLLERAAHVNPFMTQVKDLIRQPDMVRKWPALPLVIQRHIDRYPEMSQPLYDLLAGHPLTQSSDPRDRVFSLLGLLPPDERLMLGKVFPDYSLSKDLVDVITLAHLRLFSRFESFEPIFKALRIDVPVQSSRLMKIVEVLDYPGSGHIAEEAASIAGRIDFEYSASNVTQRISYGSIRVPDAAYDANTSQSRPYQSKTWSYIKTIVGFAVVAWIVYVQE